MRSVLLLIATAGLSLSQVSAPQILTVPEIEAFEADVAQNPADLSKAKLLGQNYAFQILGVTALSKYGLVTQRDPQVASSAFAAHSRQVLETSNNAIVLGEGATALWNSRMGGAAGAMLPLDQQKQAGILAEDTLNRALLIDGKQDSWHSLRISMKMLDSNFSGLPAKEAFVSVKADLAQLSPDGRYNMLASVSELAFKAGNINDAASLANELLADSDARHFSWNKGNAIHAGNMVLGQVALLGGDVSAAQTYLLAAGLTPGSPQLDSFGPNMSLARDLLAKGERNTVLKYFEECRVFWKSGSAKLEQWTNDVNAGKTPQFGANLVY